MPAASSPELPGLRLTRPHAGVLHVRMDSPPANLLNLGLWRALQSALTHAESDPSVGVLLFSSALARPIFSAGNDIGELHAPSTSEARFSAFWHASSAFLANLYETPLHTIAAVRGATPAGGCAIAMCCDERIALRDSLAFGLNEAALGIPVPKFWARLLLLLAAGRRARAERMLAFGTMVSAGEALDMGLVDRIVDGGEQSALVDVAEDAAAHVAKTKFLPATAVSLGMDDGRRKTKQVVRAEFAVCCAIHSVRLYASWILHQYLFLRL
jgi:Delta3-Delta2-enoyl-CoA isomerase